jgi:prephenate dehydratase
VTDHQPGALHWAIEPFARHRIDLVQLVSRPIPHAQWRYDSTPYSTVTR